LGKYNIRVNAISPGPIATDVLTLGLDLSEKKKEEIKLAAFGAMMQQRQPLKRLGMPKTSPTPHCSWRATGQPRSPASI